MSKFTTHFNTVIAIDTKGPIDPSSDKNNYKFVDHFSNYVVTVPVPPKRTQNAVKVSLNNLISKLEPLFYLISEPENEYCNKEMTTLLAWLNNRYHLQIHTPHWHVESNEFKTKIYQDNQENCSMIRLKAIPNKPLSLHNLVTLKFHLKRMFDLMNFFSFQIKSSIEVQS